MSPSDPMSSDRYWRILNTLSGKAQDELVKFMKWALDDMDLTHVYKVLLGCDNPDPILELIDLYYKMGLDPNESPTFKEYALEYIVLSTVKNLQEKDNDLSKKGLLVGNVPEQELDFFDLKRD